MEDDSKELSRKAKKRLKKYFEFLINTILKMLSLLRGFIQNNSAYLNERIKQNVSILFETIFGKPKAKESVIRIVGNKRT